MSIKIENTDVHGFATAIRGMRAPMNSWNKSDSTFSPSLYIGENDLKLMKSLIKAGSDHRKFMRQIIVSADITAPLYWYKEYDTYKVGTVANSCSTMHKIHAKEFTLGDFSFERTNKDCEWLINGIINVLNESREKFLETKDKTYWENMIQFLPSSYNQKRTVTMNYEVLLNMYHARKAHKLDEWRVGFCDWIKTLPYSELITGEEK